MTTIAALYVETDGCYADIPGVDAWSGSDAADGSTLIHRDARLYNGPHSTVSHPPCKRWGRFWHGSTRKPHQFKLGDDGGCFESALTNARRYGGVIEHPADSHAWAHFGLRCPKRGEGWVQADDQGGWTCYVEQGHYGHASRKPTWLLVYKVPQANLPELNWSRGEQRIPVWMLERYGYEKARRIGVVAMMGGKDKVRNRNATAPPFRDILLSIARSVEQ